MNDSERRVEMRYLGTKHISPSGIFSLLHEQQNYKFKPTAMVLEQHVEPIKKLAHIVLEADYQKMNGKPKREKPADPPKDPATV